MRDEPCAMSHGADGGWQYSRLAGDAQRPGTQELGVRGQELGVRSSETSSLGPHAFFRGLTAEAQRTRREEGTYARRQLRHEGGRKGG